MSNEKEIDDLISIAKSEPSLDYKRLGVIGKFINDLDIRPSKTKISSELIYLNYYKWARINNKKPIKSRLKFSLEFSKVFPYYKGCGRNYYFVESRKLILEEKEKWKLRRSVELSISQRKRHRGKKEKRSSQASRT